MVILKELLYEVQIDDVTLKAHVSVQIQTEAVVAIPDNPLPGPFRATGAKLVDVVLGPIDVSCIDLEQRVVDQVSRVDLFGNIGVGSGVA